MARSALVVVVAALASCGVAHSQDHDTVIVFRHHPGMLDSDANMRARDGDEETIVRALSAARIRFGAEGGLGHRGFAYHVSRDDLGVWNKIVDELLRAGKLQYYRRGLDRFGLGLYPVPSPSRPGPTS